MSNGEDNKDDAFVFGSRTARAGFENEVEIADAINAWNTNEDGRWILKEIGIDTDSINSVNAKTISGHKSDVVVNIINTCGKSSTVGIQVKLVSNKRGYNQIDKRWTDNYQNLWNMPETVTNALKLYTGEESHSAVESRDERRLFADELEACDSKLILDFLWNNKGVISKTVFRGDSKYPADWMIVVQNHELIRRIFVFDINIVMGFYFDEMPTITRRGNFKFGKVTIQRKGGDRGRDTAKMLQFKIDPIKIVEAIEI